MGRILILDDVREAAVMVQKVLQRKGHQAHVFDDEDEALRFVQKQPLDLAILDMKLRKIDGFEMLAEIKKVQPHLPVILLTGFPSLDAARRALQLGAAAYCAKPIDKSELEGKVAEILAGQRPTMKRDSESRPG